MTEAEINQRKLVDFHLKSIATLTANRGLDSTENELKEIKLEMNSHYEAIKLIDPEFYSVICI